MLSTLIKSEQVIKVLYAWYHAYTTLIICSDLISVQLVYNEYNTVINCSAISASADADVINLQIIRYFIHFKIIYFEIFFIFYL